MKGWVKMKKIAFLIIALLLILCSGNGLATQNQRSSLCLSTIAANTEKPQKIKNLKITTANKSKYLKLTWNAQPEAKGYQIFRSTSGKTGTYERIAVVKKAAYADKGLKNSTTYYYKVRAYAKQNGNTIYGAFAKTNLSTRVTADYVAKRFGIVYKAMDRFFTETAVSYENTFLFYLREDLDKYGLEHEGEYISSSFQTKAEAVSVLQKYLTKKPASNLVDYRFFYIDGELYLWVPVGGAEEYLILDKITASINNGSDRALNVTVHSLWRGLDGDYPVDYRINVKYENGRWVFDDHRVWYSAFYSYGYSYYS